MKQEPKAYISCLK